MFVIDYIANVFDRLYCKCLGYYFANVCVRLYCKYKVALLSNLLGKKILSNFTPIWKQTEIEDLYFQIFIHKKCRKEESNPGVLSLILSKLRLCSLWSKSLEDLW